jgi:hypothetical protein
MGNAHQQPDRAMTIEPATNDDDPDEFRVKPAADLSDAADVLADLVGPLRRKDMTRDEVAQLRAAAAVVLYNLGERNKGVEVRNNGTQSQGRVSFGRSNANEAGLAFFINAEDISAAVAEEYEQWQEEHGE